MLAVCSMLFMVMQDARASMCVYLCLIVVCLQYVYLKLVDARASMCACMSMSDCSVFAVCLSEVGGWQLACNKDGR